MNAHGLSALSIRAVANDLGLSPGNVWYHFRRKEDLVAALVGRLATGNRSQLERAIGSLGEFFELFRVLFRNQYEHRGLVLARPDVLETFEGSRADYRRIEAQRRRGLFDLLASLRANGAIAGTVRAGSTASHSRLCSFPTCGHLGRCLTIASSERDEGERTGQASQHHGSRGSEGPGSQRAKRERQRHAGPELSARSM